MDGLQGQALSRSQLNRRQAGLPVCAQKMFDRFEVTRQLPGCYVNDAFLDCHDYSVQASTNVEGCTDIRHGRITGADREGAARVLSDAEICLPVRKYCGPGLL